MPQVADEERFFLLATLTPDVAQRRLAAVMLGISVIAFAVLAPFAKTKLAPVWGFIPAYEAALVINDLITAVLLLGQFNILRLRALLVLASGYLFTAAFAFVHALSFPGLFAPSGLLGAGPQTTAWLYMAWHAGFPIFVMAYSRLKDRPTQVQAPMRAAVLAAVGVLALVGAFTLLTTAGQGWLPAIMAANHYTPLMLTVVGITWLASLAALVVVWRRRMQSVIDLWLTVVMYAWLFDIALSAVLNGGRFDLGFYAGRLYGFAASAFVLIVLLLENGMLYARLLAAHRESANKAAQLGVLNRELESFSYSVSHDLRAPLRAINGFTGLLERRYGDVLDVEGKRLLGVVRDNCRHMGDLIEDLLAFSRLGRQPLTTRAFALDDLVNEAIRDLQVQAAGRDIAFQLDPLGEVMGDRSLLKQVVLNLIGNAIKFTRDKARAVVEIGCQRAGETGGERVFYVRDNGAGFDMRHIDKLFGVFQRLHTADEFDGTGVGLAIVQRVIQRHGGRVWAEAAPGAGATFFFTLPTEGGAPA